MSADVAIRVEGLSKQYRIGLRPEKYKTMRDTIAQGFGNLLRRSPARADNETFWAVNDLSFEIKCGEVVGVIGRNGAGKSTLLKLLARITEPTRGHADIRGRIGALLEVGTGFHHELTGRENIFLNGAILGMRRNDIERKFDEIVEFSEVGKFIDTPVKRYSSGMHLRLAFSVAAHLEPEILLVDEVLAVGDTAFQKKCVGKMENVASQGRTVLFVSHNLAAIKELCQTSLVLSQGQLAYRGTVTEGLAHYSETVASAATDEATRGTHWRYLKLIGQAPNTSASFRNDETFGLDCALELEHPITRGYLFAIASDAVGNQIIHQRVELSQLERQKLEAGIHQIHLQFPVLWLAPGVYTFHLKFIGYNDAGIEERQLSERLLVEITGAEEGISRSLVAPPPQWQIVSQRQS
jgi:lipopolysaccharide transport system ATP-binding protein